MTKRVTVIGGGLAGSEAALQLANQNIEVDLYEMRPVVSTPAHVTDQFGELVCSNSLGSISPGSASQILKEELAQLGCLLLSFAQESKVPAGASLAIDRKLFADKVTHAVTSHPHIQVHREEVSELPKDRPCLIATGPLTSKKLIEAMTPLLHSQSLYFYDAISPIVSADSLDFSKMYKANRYDKGETADFWNVPLDRVQYETLVHDLLTSECVLPHDFEEEKYFEGCMPIEAIAARGLRTLAFGPMKPVGLRDPKTGKTPAAVIQLRAENKYETSYNLVGFQTKLKYPEQIRVFKKLPGFENAEFLRLGSMHRNTYIESPRVLQKSLQLKAHPLVWFAGQLTGTEGYLESIATGLVASKNILNFVKDLNAWELPPETMLGSLIEAITDPEKIGRFQPLNANLGILPPLEEKIKDKKLRNQKYAERSRTCLQSLQRRSNLDA